jgi:hypothetical protein
LAPRRVSSCSPTFIRILLVDDFERFRSFNSSLLGKQPGFQIVGGCVRRTKAVQKAEELKPDLCFSLVRSWKSFSKNVFKNDVALRNGEDSYELPVPAAYLVDTKGIIRFAHADEDYMTGRAEPEAVVAALEGIERPVAH